MHGTDPHAAGADELEHRRIARQSGNVIDDLRARSIAALATAALDVSIERMALGRFRKISLMTGTTRAALPRP